MLTIKAPIELHSTAFRLRDDGGFAERILSMHSFLGADIRAESLTHLLHTPPEIVVAETAGGENVSNTNITAFREEQLTVINNMMNRILLSESYPLTYQDRVFITSSLHRLGIRDDRRFMEEVRNLLRETDNSRELISLYLTHIGDLQQMLSLTEQTRIEERYGEERHIEETREDNRLYMSILNRLQTGAIYQIVSNMNRQLSEQVLGPTEVLISEQSYTARQLLLTRFREMATGERQPLIYRADNLYEEETRSEEEITPERIRERINSAVLLEVIRSFDHALSVRTERPGMHWTEFSRSYYRSADHTLERILTEAAEHRNYVRQERSELETVLAAGEKELEILRELFLGGDSIIEQLLRVQSDYFTYGPEHMEFVTEREREFMESRFARYDAEREREFSSAETEYRTEASEETIREEVERLALERTGSTEISRELRERLEREVRERLTEAGGTALEREFSSAETEYRTEASEETVREEVERLARERTGSTEISRELREHLEREVRERLTEGGESVREREFSSAETEYRTEATHRETVQEEMERINRENTERMERYREIRQIVRNETATRRTVSDRQRTMRESLRVLQDAGHLKEILEQETAQGPVTTNRVMEKLYELLPADTVAIFRQLEAEKQGGGAPAPQVPESEFVEQELTHFVEEPAVQEAPVRQEEPEPQKAAPEQAPAPAAVDVTELMTMVTRILTEGAAEELLTDYSTLVTREIREQERQLNEVERIARMAYGRGETEALELILNGGMGAQTPVAEVRIDHGRRQMAVAFTHRQEEWLTEDQISERLEEIRRNQVTTQTTRIVEEPVRVNEIHHRAPTVVNQTTTHTMSREETEDIARLVEQGVRRQIGTIAGEVYQRLEKRLKTEKARRGI